MTTIASTLGGVCGGLALLCLLLWNSLSDYKDKYSTAVAANETFVQAFAAVTANLEAQDVLLGEVRKAQAAQYTLYKQTSKQIQTLLVNDETFKTWYSSSTPNTVPELLRAASGADADSTALNPELSVDSSEASDNP